MKRLRIQLLFTFFLLLTCFCAVRLAAAYDQKMATAQVSVVGEYYRGNGLGRNDSLHLKNDKTFAFSKFSDDGQSAKWSGTYTFQNSHVTLFPSEESLQQRTHFSLSNLAILSWGERLYLIPDEQMRDFCNDINLGEEPRGDIHGSYFARRGRSQQMNLDRVIGWPTLPAPWNSFLLATPVKAPITAIVHTGRKDKNRDGEANGEIIALTVHAGSHQGLKTGMLLFMHTTPEFTKKYLNGDEYAIIRSVKSNECVAEFMTYVPDLPVKIGMVASTRLDKSTVEFYQHSPKPQTGGGG